MRNAVLMLSVFFCAAAFGQISVRNNSLVLPDKKVAYRNFNNELEITGMEVDASTVIISRGEKLNRYDDVFAYIPMFPVESDTLRIFSDGEEVGEIVVKIEALISPRVYFGELRKATVKLDYLLSNPGLHLSYEPQYAIPNYYVSGCEIIIRKGGKKGKEMIVHGNAFSPKQLKTLSKLVSGDVLEFKRAQISDFLGYNEEINANFELTVE